ncbi:MAG: class I SAM-dependent methyltransferase [Bacteroidota bacterium]
MHAALRYLWHWLTAVNEHSLHSPFIYNLYTRGIKKEPAHEDFNIIEKFREKLINSDKIIEVEQLGAESKVSHELNRPVSVIAKKGMTPARNSHLLYNIIRYFDYKNIIELGTSFGINTLYLATNTQVKVTTFEGCYNTSKIAQDIFDELNYENIDLIFGNIDKTLPEFLKYYPDKIDMAYIDANHTLEATLSYFDLLLPFCSKTSLIIIDDIYWSPDMTRAWKTLISHPKVSTSVDLYQFGMIFFNPDLEKREFTLMF